MTFLCCPPEFRQKKKSGASGGFLPKPLLLYLRPPNSKKISRVLCEILSPKNIFRKKRVRIIVLPSAQKHLPALS